MEKSSFQFTNPRLTDIEMHINEDFNGQKNAQIPIQMKISVHISSKEDAKEAIVALTAEIGQKDSNVPFWVKATEQASFRWDEEVSDTMREALLNQNAPSLLLAYLRPVVAQITNASPYGAYDIPFVNFAKNISD